MPYRLLSGGALSRDSGRRWRGELRSERELERALEAVERPAALQERAAVLLGSVPDRELVPAEAEEAAVEAAPALAREQHDERGDLLRLAECAREALGWAVAVRLE